VAANPQRVAVHIRILGPSRPAQAMDRPVPHCCNRAEHVSGSAYHSELGRGARCHREQRRDGVGRPRRRVPQPLRRCRPLSVSKQCKLFGILGSRERHHRFTQCRTAI
jgi:hypothetical protein